MMELRVVKTDSVSLTVGADKGITEVLLPEGGGAWPVDSYVNLEGMQPSGDAEVVPVGGGGLGWLQRYVREDGSGTCNVTQTLDPVGESVRWSIVIAGGGDQTWGPVVSAGLRVKEPERFRFWTAWSDPAGGRRAEGEPEWLDPLVLMPLRDSEYWYGATPFRYANPHIAFCPFGDNLTAIPLATLAREGTDAGLSLVSPPGESPRELSLTTTAGGDVFFTWAGHRLPPGGEVAWSLDIAPHEADWRGGMRWMCSQYPEYFEPVNANASNLAGTGAYSAHGLDFDAERLRRMAFRTNWKASFDFPYMGLFLPPLEDVNEEWQRYGGGPTSIAGMAEYSRRMREMGFHVLNYFNVTEFGANMQWPPPARTIERDEDLWRDCSQYGYACFDSAILRAPDQTPAESYRHYPRTKPGTPYFTWGDAVAMDPGDPAYREYLLEQARRHLRHLPESSGICIDRMDWLRLYRPGEDDGVSWFEGGPARSLYWSWERLMDDLGPLMHDADKVIFVNNHVKRLDLLRRVDGIFDEFTYAHAPLNLTALLTVRKPALGWTSNAGNLQPDPDAFFQKYLHLGVFPMAPFPSNDHSLGPSEEVDRLYLRYGPLLEAMRGRTWVLDPHPVEVRDGAARANLFRVPEGFLAPITAAGPNESVDVTVRCFGEDADGAAPRCMWLAPGHNDWQPVQATVKDGALHASVPVRDGCALLRIDWGEE